MTFKVYINRDGSAYYAGDVTADTRIKALAEVLRCGDLGSPLRKEDVMLLVDTGIRVANNSGNTEQESC